jgi:hypothetical protein
MKNGQHKYRWPWEIQLTFLNHVRKGKLVNENDYFQIYIHQNGQQKNKSLNTLKITLPTKIQAQTNGKKHN